MSVVGFRVSCFVFRAQGLGFRVRDKYVEAERGWRCNVEKRTQSASKGVSTVSSPCHFRRRLGSVLNYHDEQVVAPLDHLSVTWVWHTPAKDDKLNELDVSSPELWPVPGFQKRLLCVCKNQLQIRQQRMPHDRQRLLAQSALSNSACKPTYHNKQNKKPYAYSLVRDRGAWFR